MKSILLLGIAGAVALAAAPACITAHPPPVKRLHKSEESMRAAQQVGAQDDPEARAHLSLAQQQIAEARRLMDDGDNERADWVLARAYTDAQLAEALAMENWTRTDAAIAVEQVAAMRRARAAPAQRNGTQQQPVTRQANATR